MPLLPLGVASSNTNMLFAVAAVELTLGVPMAGRTGKGEYAYFVVKHTDMTYVRFASLRTALDWVAQRFIACYDSVCRTLLTIEALPANKSSDPDLYVSPGRLDAAAVAAAAGNSKEQEKQKEGLGNKNVCTWKSCLIGRDRVDIHPTDPKVCPPFPPSHPFPSPRSCVAEAKVARGWWAGRGRLVHDWSVGVHRCVRLHCVGSGKHTAYVCAARLCPSPNALAICSTRHFIISS
jgi:hypothetical protein